MAWDYECKQKQQMKKQRKGQEFINQIYLLKPTIHASIIKKALGKKKSTRIESQSNKQK